MSLRGQGRTHLHCSRGTTGFYSRTAAPARVSVISMPDSLCEQPPSRKAPAIRFTPIPTSGSDAHADAVQSLHIRRQSLSNLVNLCIAVRQYVPEADNIPRIRNPFRDCRSDLVKTVHRFAANLQDSLHGSAGLLIREVAAAAPAQVAVLKRISAEIVAGDLLCLEFEA